MDLLCSPENPTMPLLKAPYLGGERWDGGLFLTYPQRKGKMKFIPPELRIGPLATDEPYPLPTFISLKQEINSFCQTWLFFGLASEFLALNEQQDGNRMISEADTRQEIEQLYRDCIMSKDGQDYLTGLKFASRVSTAFSQRLAESNSSVSSRYAYLRRCLDAAYFMIEINQTPLDEGVKYPIAALGDFLAHLGNLATSQLPPSQVETFNVEESLLNFTKPRSYLQRNSLLEVKMTELGWCISDIERMRAMYSSFGTLYYLSHLKPPTRQDHRSCTRKQCVTAQIDPKNYKPLHIHKGIWCGNIQIDESYVRKILRAGSYPVLEVQKSRIKIEEYSSSVPYIALSHVCADGLGSPSASRLPKCQLKRISALISNLQKTLRVSTEFRLWIDTLLCPVDGDEKKIAFRRMADVYRNAAHVLVLDSSLMAYSTTDSSIVELTLRLFGVSSWMRRLWTFQEAVLSRSLYIQFADQAVKAVDLLKILHSQIYKDLRLAGIWHDMIRELKSLHQLDSVIPTDADPIGSGFLYDLQRAVYFRSISVSIDEPFCLATLLSLDIDYVIDVDDAVDRMIRVWELISRRQGIPSQIIFSVENTINRPGWKWAPRSFLNSGTDTHISYDNACTRLSEYGDLGSSYRGILSPYGIRVQFAGSQLHVRTRAPGVPLHPWTRLTKSEEFGIVWARNEDTGKWFQIVDADDSGLVSNNILCDFIDNKDCLLIYNPNLALPALRLARLVESYAGDPSTANLDDRPIYVRGLRSVSVTEHDSGPKIIANAMHEIANQAASDQVTTDLVKATHNSSEEDLDTAIEAMKGFLIQTTTKSYDADPKLAQAFEDMDIARENVWKFLIKWFSHDAILVDLPDDQEWIVD